jgi:hypothetical protein
MNNFRPINRGTEFLLPPIDEWLRQRHLARFVVEAIDTLDLSGLPKAYRGSNSASYHPAMRSASSNRRWNIANVCCEGWKTSKANGIW